MRVKKGQGNNECRSFCCANKKGKVLTNWVGHKQPIQQVDFQWIFFMTGNFPTSCACIAYKKVSLVSQVKIMEQQEVIDTHTYTRIYLLSSEKGRQKFHYQWISAHNTSNQSQQKFPIIPETIKSKKKRQKKKFGKWDIQKKKFVVQADDAIFSLSSCSIISHTKCGRQTFLVHVRYKIKFKLKNELN